MDKQRSSKFVTYALVGSSVAILGYAGVSGYEAWKYWKTFVSVRESVQRTGEGVAKFAEGKGVRAAADGDAVRVRLANVGPVSQERTVLIRLGVTTDDVEDHHLQHAVGGMKLDEVRLAVWCRNPPLCTEESAVFIKLLEFDDAIRDTKI